MLLLGIFFGFPFGEREGVGSSKVVVGKGIGLSFLALGSGYFVC